MAEADMHVPVPKINNEESLVRTTRSSLDRTIKKNEEKAVVKPKVTKRELTFREKLKRSFVKEDLADVRDYVVFDIIIPNVRKAFFDTIVGTAAQIFGISVPAGRYGYSPTTATPRITPHERRYRDYSSISNDRYNGYSGEEHLTRYDRFYVSDWVFTYKEAADDALMKLMDICDASGWVSVARFFEIVDPQGTAEGRNPYTNNNYGWHNVDSATVKYITNVGYVIEGLPPARPR